METQPQPQTAICWACAAHIEAQDSFCRRCGKGQGEKIHWYYRHWGIITSTLLGLGPFGLILVWRSPLLTPKARWIYTAAILLLTWYVGVSIYQGLMLLQGAVDSALKGLPL